MDGHGRELLILRHGQAESPYGKADLERELTDPGKRDIQRVGVHLQGRQWLPDATVVSPATRTMITAEKTLKAGGRGIAALTVDPRIYEASAATLRHVLHDFAKAPPRVMLVGHNPGVSELVAFLSGRRIPMAPGMLARVALPSDWTALHRGCGTLLDLVDPQTLPREFPFPGPGGSELRRRPAYYYVQSGVVPYRRSASGLEVLIIGSSKRKRWVMPKGIVTPGLTSQASAAKEAREEAGIEGTVDGPSLGSFTYDKWGASVTCEFFPMEVHTVLDDAQWDESHRGRRWVGVGEATEMLGRDGLKRMVRALAKHLGC